MKGFFLLATASRPALGPTHPPILWVLRVKRPGREANRSPSASVEVQNAWRYTSTDSRVFTVWHFIKQGTRFSRPGT